MSDIRAGDVWFAWFEPGVGHEQHGRRPVIVVSSDRFHATGTDLVWVVPITRRERGFSTQPLIHTPEGGLNQDSVAMCDQLRAIDRSRLRKRIGELSPSTFRMIQGTVITILTG